MMVRVTKSEYVRLKALEEAAKEFADADYRKVRSELGTWKATFEMLANGEVYDELQRMEARVKATKEKFLHRHIDLEKELGFTENVEFKVEEEASE